MVILSDLSEVLIRGLYGTEDIIEWRYGREAGERFWQRHLEAATNTTWCDAMRGKCSEDDYWQKICEDDELGLSAAELKDAFSENLSRKVPGTLDVYQRIVGAPRSLKPGAEITYGRTDIRIVSDHVRERLAELQKLHPAVFTLATRCYWSFETGLLKGDSGFFARLLKESNLAPDEVVFVDDMQCNVDAAKEAGINAIQFLNAEQLEQELSGLGFRFF